VTGIALLLVAAAVGFGAARLLGIPAIPLLVLAGVALARVVDLSPSFLEDALVLGIAFLVFVAGAELNPARVRTQKRAAIVVGLVQFVFLGSAGAVAALLMGFPFQTAAYLALALTTSSTVVVVRLLQNRRQLFEPYGRLVIGVLLIQDALVILLIPVITRLPEGWIAVTTGVGGTLGLLALAYVGLRWVAPLVVLRLGRNEEALLLAALTFLFFFLGLASALGLPMVAGAFVAGVSLSAFPINGLVRGQVQPIADFFSALFYTALGAFLTLPNVQGILQVALLTLLIVVLTPPLVAVVAERSGFSARPAIFSGLLLSQASEFSLVVGLQGMVLGQLTQDVFTLIALVTVVTMVLSPLLATDRVTLALMRFHPVLRRGTPGDPPQGHVLIVGCGANGMPLLETLVIGPYRVVAVDDDPAVVERVREAGIQCIRGDAADQGTLRAAGVAHARAVISTIRRPQDNDLLLTVAAGVPVIVRGFDEADADWIRARGGRPILYSEAATDDFLAWLEGDEGPTSTNAPTPGLP